MRTCARYGNHPWYLALSCAACCKNDALLRNDNATRYAYGLAASDKLAGFLDSKRFSSRKMSSLLNVVAIPCTDKSARSRRSKKRGVFETARVCSACFKSMSFNPLIGIFYSTIRCDRDTD